jgi:hypothetical protein
MAKRLTDTEKWNDDWYLSLDNDYRIIWQWLLDNCSHAGFCKRSMTLLNLMCRLSITEEHMIDKMNGRVLIHGNDWFIPKFIKFQYPTLMSQKPVILSVVKELFTKKAIHLIPVSYGNDYLIKEECFDNHYQMIKDKSKDKDKDKDSLTGDKKNIKINTNGSHAKFIGDFKAQREVFLAERNSGRDSG